MIESTTDSSIERIDSTGKRLFLSVIPFRDLQVSFIIDYIVSRFLITYITLETGVVELDRVQLLSQLLDHISRLGELQHDVCVKLI